MEIYSQKSEYTLLQGNMLDMWDFVGGGTIDSIVTDPPYELNFMWKGWDNSWIAFQPDTWKRCLEALKPWWYLLAFGGSRTYHRIACAIEDAGFEIRDCIMWLYGSWFPKSLNIWLAIDKKNWVDNRTWKVVEWVGSNQTLSMRNWLSESMEFKSEYEERKATNERAWWGTALKPSYEPIIVARKPLEWSCTDNVIKYWVGGINIDECRVAYINQKDYEGTKVWFKEWSIDTDYTNVWRWFRTSPLTTNNWFSITWANGRFPANTILTYDESDFEEVCWWFPDTKSWSKMSFGSVRKAQPDNTYQLWFTKKENSWQTAPDNYWDSGNASRYFKNCNFSLRDIDQWKQLYVSNAEKSLEILSETIESIVPISADMLLWMLKDLNVKYAENQLDLWEIHIVPDIVEILNCDFKKEGLQAILDFIGNYKNCIQLQSLVQFVEKCDSIDTTQTTQNLLKLFGYVRAAITKYTQTIRNEEQKRYIYTPKASKRDRDEWLDGFEESNSMCDRNPELASANMPQNRSWNLRKNTHPTVKPCDLMQYLVRLVTPNGWTVLDPFNWSGSTWKAVMYENKDRNKNYKYIWIELTEEYLPIAKARIEYVINKGIEKEKSDPKQEEQTKQRKESALF